MHQLYVCKDQMLQRRLVRLKDRQRCKINIKLQVDNSKTKCNFILMIQQQNLRIQIWKQIKLKEVSNKKLFMQISRNISPLILKR